VKNSPGHYKQGDTIVCEKCFSTENDMVCLRCNGRRTCVDSILVMSCPCYDFDIHESDITDDHTDDSWLDDDDDDDDDPE
jgi:hypothetical protein